MNRDNENNYVHYLYKYHTIEIDLQKLSTVFPAKFLIP